MLGSVFTIRFNASTAILYLQVTVGTTVGIHLLYINSEEIIKL